MKNSKRIMSRDVEKMIEDRIKEGKANRQRWDEKEAEEKKELKKREHLFKKFEVQRPSWWWQPGVTRVVFNGENVTFNRKGFEPFIIEDIKKCAIMIDDGGTNGEDDIPFDFTTEHHVSYSYSTSRHTKDGIKYYTDGTEMSVHIETREYQEELEQQEEEMREALGCI